MGHHVRERGSSVRSFVTVEETSLRARMEAAIESMLALLDELDGEPALEPDNDDEPWLGFHRIGGGETWEDDGSDREFDIADDPHDPDTDREHTAPERAGRGFVACGGDDEEDDDPGEEETDAEFTAPERAGRGFVACGGDDEEDDKPFSKGFSGAAI